MTTHIDPFEHIRKNAHIWRGENALLWYSETIEGGFSIKIFYERGGKKRCCILEIDEKNNEVSFDNKTLTEEKWNELLPNVELMERLIGENPNYGSYNKAKKKRKKKSK